MGLMGQFMSLIFGDGRNVVAETAEVFRVNADKSDQRDVARTSETLKQFAAEFARPQAGVFNRLVDAANRLPRPLMALGTIGLFISAMSKPAWFSERMLGLALVPEPMWWLMGAIVSFYFGARHQVKGQAFQRDLLQMAAAKQLVQTAAPEASNTTAPRSNNAALQEWRATS